MIPTSASGAELVLRAEDIHTLPFQINPLNWNGRIQFPSQHQNSRQLFIPPVCREHSRIGSKAHLSDQIKSGSHALRELCTVSDKLCLSYLLRSWSLMFFHSFVCGLRLLGSCSDGPIVIVREPTMDETPHKCNGFPWTCLRNLGKKGSSPIVYKENTKSP